MSCFCHELLSQPGGAGSGGTSSTSQVELKLALGKIKLFFFITQLEEITADVQGREKSVCAGVISVHTQVSVSMHTHTLVHVCVCACVVICTSVCLGLLHSCCILNKS